MKNAIVTGASKGLGRVIARALAKEGHNLYVSARDERALQALKKEAESEGDTQVHIDLINFLETEAVVAYGHRLAAQLPSVDVLVNNIGIYIPDKLDSEMHLVKHMTVNFYGAFHLTQSLIERFIKQKHGHVFNILSVVNRKPRVDAASYTISKFALYGYHQVLQKTLRPHGIKVTGFFPSSINTSSWEGVDAPKQDFIQPEDIAAMIVSILKMERGTIVSDIDLASINPDF